MGSRQPFSPCPPTPCLRAIGRQPATQEAFPLELRQYFDILKRHKWFIIEAIVAAGLVAGILSSLRTPVYKATARVLLTPNDPNQQLNPTSGSGAAAGDPDRYVAGQITIAQSDAVATEAAKSLPSLTASKIEAAVSVSQSGQSNILAISANDTDARQARDVADAVAKGYIENRRQAAVSGLQGAADDIQSKLGPLQTQIAQYDAQIGDGSTVAGSTSTLVSPINPSATLAPSQPASQVPPPTTTGLGGAPSTQEALKAARYAAAVQYETLYSRQQELLVDISLKRGDAELIADAKTPTSSISPRPKRDATLGAVVGLLLGIGISLVREQLNDRVRSALEVERLSGLPVLAQLPYDEDAARDRRAGLAVVNRGASALSEAVRALRTSIQFLGVDQPAKVIVVTSAGPGEGKSLVAANLAAAFAQADYRTLLISADLRRSSIDSMFGELLPSVGLTGVLAPLSVHGKSQPVNGQGNGHAAGDLTGSSIQALRETSVPGLLLLPSGPTPPNPAELLASKRMTLVLQGYSGQSDIIIIDSPPLLPVTDAAVLSAKCDGVLLVAALNEVRRDAISRARAILDGAGVRILGVVINKVPSSRNEGYYYAGYYGHSAEENTKSTSRRRIRGSTSAEGPVTRSSDISAR